MASGKTSLKKLPAERGIELVLVSCKTGDEIIVTVSDAEAIIVQYAPITDRVLAALPTLKAIDSYGVGVDTLDVGAKPLWLPHNAYTASRPAPLGLSV